MEYAFYKMNGLGNDFVVLDRLDRTESPEDFPAIARKVCHRRLSVGADGLLVIFRSADDTDARMRIFNADGSEAQMCGNGIRCVALHLFSTSAKTDMRIATLSGIRHVSVSNGCQGFRATVDMGAAIFNTPDIPVMCPSQLMLDTPLCIGDMPSVRITAVSMGNPHGVTFVDSVENAAVCSVGPRLETHPVWPEKANIEFVQLIDRHTLRMRAWERGVGETEACGTGACAAAAAAVATGRADYPVEVRLPGGNLLICTDKRGHTLMCGPAEYCFKGTFNV